MKTLQTLSLFFILSLLTTSIIAADKHALLVGIGKYPDNSGWQKLGSAEDIKLVRQSLQNQGFKPANIAILQDQKATKNNILQSIQNLANRVKRGDIVVFHFSGHGQQVIDDNEDELDGLDEAIVPYDSPLHYQANVYEGENLIRDEELGNALNIIREKIGKNGHLLVLLDACHSGTGTRGNWANTRGTELIMRSPLADFSREKKIGDANSLMVNNNRSTTNQAPLISFFAASPNELNYEVILENGQSVGALSYAFSKVFSKAKTTTSYQALFDQIAQEMNALVPDQTPQREGSLDRTILGGQIIGNTPFYKVKDYFNSKNSSINAGTLVGISEGTVVGFYPRDTRDFKQTPPIVKGTITYATPLDADVVLERPISKKQLLDSWVYVLQQNFGTLKVRLQIVQESTLKKDLLRQLYAVDALSFVYQNPDLILVKNQEGMLQLMTRSAQLLWQDLHNKPADILAQKLLQKIRSYSQADFLKKLQVETPQLTGSIQLVLSNNSTIQKKQSIPSLKVGDSFKIVVSNQGSLPFYYNILDIQPDYQINVLVPNPEMSKQTAADFYLKPGQTQEIPILMEVFPPVGTDVLKLVTADQPLDLNILLNQQGNRGQHKTSHPFETLFAHTFLAAYPERGGTTANVPSGSVGVSSMLFHIGKN